jgi:T5SS/PEP-CTERM-associated repeat protein
MTIALGAGWKDHGSLAILDGIAVKSSEGYLGYSSGSTGVATVSGSGSTWDVINGHFGIGRGGSGTLSITNGGGASGPIYIGSDAGSKGTVTVDGAGSTFSCSSLLVGIEGSGIVSITHGGRVDSYGGVIASSPSATGTRSLPPASAQARLVRQSI